MAKLTFVTLMKEGGNIPVNYYEELNCSDHPGKRLAFLNSYAIGTKFSPKATVTIPSEKRFIFSIFAVPVMAEFLGGSNETGYKYKQIWCAPVIEFTPRAGYEYIAIHNATRNECSIKVFNVNAETGEQTPEPSAHINRLCSQTLKTK